MNIKLMYTRIFILGLSLLSMQVVSGNHPATGGNPGNKVSAEYLKALLRFEPWAESVWKDYAAIPGSGYFGDGEDDGNGGIRGNAGITVCYVTLIRAFPNAPERKRRLKRVEAALRYAAMTHESGPKEMLTVNGKKWGVSEHVPISARKGWQTSMWSAFMGLAAALIEKELDPEVVKGCKRVVAEEASWRAKIPPPSRYRLNSAGEETGWQSNVLALAAAWMPDDPKAQIWMNGAKKYLANTYTVPKDSTGPLKEWISTQTLFPSYAMENHGFYHPAYQKDGGQSMGDAYLMASMVNPAIGKELQPFAEHNVMEVWGFLKGVFLESGDMAFPSGMDWTLHQFEHAPYIAWLAAHYDQPEAQWLEPIIARQILLRQQVTGDGRFIGESCPDGFYVEALQSLSVSMAYLHNEMAGFPEKKGTPLKNHLTHYEDVGLIIHRSDKSVTTISYGSKTMALAYPRNGKGPAREFMISPNTSSLIGSDSATIIKSYQQTGNGFRATFTLNGKKVKRNSEVVIESAPEYTALIEIAKDKSQPQADWYLLAIENHPLTGGVRHIRSEGLSALVRERSDTLLTPVSAGWINVDNWLGIATPTKGLLHYRTAKEYNRNGAAEDAIVFESEHNDHLRAVILLPQASSSMTKKVQKSFRTRQTQTEFFLSFKIPGQKRREISASLTPGP